MSLLNLIKKEWSSIFKNKMTLLSVIGLFFIPVLYSSIFLWAFWDPYGHTDKLPVAVVNLDKPAIIENKTVHAGLDMINNLKSNHKFDWKFVSKSEATKGLENNKYYMVIEIPRNFSTNVTTLTTPNPAHLELKYMQDESSNYIVSLINKNAMNEIKTEVSNSVSNQYAKILFDKIDFISDGLKSASGGSQDITNGLNSLSSGTNDLLNGLKDKTQNLHDLTEGAAAVKNGAVQLQNGMSQSIAGEDTLLHGSSSLEENTNKIVNGTNSLLTGMGQWKDGMNKTNEASKQLTEGLKHYLEAHPELQKDIQFQTLIATSQAISDGANQLTTSSATLQSGMRQVSENLSLVNEGQAKITTGIENLENAQKSIYNGSKSLVSGATKLQNGNEQVETGWNNLISNVTALKNGNDKLLNGSKELTSKLANAASDTKLNYVSEKTYNMVSNPVLVKKEAIHEVPNYGTGMAPYMMSISLFVGALMLSIVIELQEIVDIPKTGFGLFFSKLLTLVIVGIFQALIVDSVLIHTLGLKVENVEQFIGLSILTSMTFMALIQLLVKPLGNVGRFVAVIILILQITSTSGTFPVETAPNFMQSAHNWLPVTYSIEGFRAAISSNNYNIIHNSEGKLWLFFVAFASITWLYSIFQVKNLRRKN